MTKTIRSLTLLALSGSLLSACAQERDPIDRVQPNYLDKAYFLDTDGDGTNDEWYYQRTVVDVPVGNGFTVVGDTDWWSLKKVTWDIQENFIYARRSIPLVKNGDVDHGTEDYEGEIMAAYRILSHFDITYAYNPTTGEKLNILNENMTDRPWYERQYMRVDWSQNLITNYDFWWDMPSVEPVPYYVQDYDSTGTNRNDDAPRFEPDYFDITNKVIARAGTVYYPYFNMNIPLCWLDEFIECGTGEYAIRNSFAKIDKTHQYEPFPYKGKMTEVFGYFWTDRDVFSEDGVYIQDRERYMQRQNLFKTWYDDNGDLLPVSQRELKPIVYHVNGDWPSEAEAPEINESAREIERQYNDIFREAVNVQLADEGADPLPEEQKMFILCANNPVKETDPAECGPAGTAPRIGDLRYSFLAWVPNFTNYGLLGFGPSNTDPETGEIVSGMAYIYERNNYYAHRTAEMVQLLNGTLDRDTYIAGVDFDGWYETVTGERERTSDRLKLNDFTSKIHRMANGWSSQLWEGRRHQITAADEQFQREHGVEQWVQPHLDRLYYEGHLHGTGDNGLGKLSKLAGTEIEDMMIDDEVLMAVGHDPRLPAGQDVLDRASVLRGGFGSFIKGRSELIETLAMEKNMYLPSMADNALIGLARQVAEEDRTYEEIVSILKTASYTGVIAHEIGHSLGLMHNFGASDDAINYYDEYWQIRDDGNVGPRVDDPITEAELNAHIYDYATSSTMDYMRFPQDRHGLGKYDRAAFLFGYAGKVEVFDDTATVPVDDLAEWYNSDGDPLWFYGSGPEAKHYTYYYNAMGEDLYSADNRRLVNYTAIKDDWSSTFGQEGKARVPYIYCSHSRYNLGDSCLTRDFGADAGERIDHVLDEMNTWYITRSFPRGIIGVDQWNYVGRMYRLYDRLKSWHDIYGLYKDFLPTFYTADQLETFFADTEDGWGVKSYAVNKAFNHLIQTILMPDVNDYVFEAQPDGRTIYKISAFGGGPVVTDVSNARYFSTSWTNEERECGYMFWECLHHVGFYLDKIMAIEALSDSETNFVGRSTPEDIREWEISYYTTFADEIAKINSAIVGGDWAEVAPYWEGGELQWPNYSSEMTQSHATPVDPFATFTIQLYWQVLGRARFPNTYDVSFVEESRLFVQGTGLEPDVPDDRIVTYHDPVSGLTYCAVTYEGNGAAEKAIEKANRMKARSDMCDDGTETPDNDADDCVGLEPGLNRVQVSAALMNYHEVLKTMVLIDQRMDWGNPYDP